MGYRLIRSRVDWVYLVCALVSIVSAAVIIVRAFGGGGK